MIQKKGQDGPRELTNNIEQKAQTVHQENLYIFIYSSALL